MPNEIKIYGHSDDLIEIEGAHNEEIYANHDDPTILEITPGYVLNVRYEPNGVWTIDVIEEPENANYKHHGQSFDAGPNDYTEVLRINQPGVDYEVEKR